MEDQLQLVLFSICVSMGFDHEPKKFMFSILLSAMSLLIQQGSDEILMDFKRRKDQVEKELRTIKEAKFATKPFPTYKAAWV